jgi:hypothetical protein
MTVDEKLLHIERALAKVRVMAEGHASDTFSYAECDVIEGALTFVVGVYHGYHDFFKDRSS